MNLTSSLQTHFGFDSFRAGQEEAITSLLNKQHTLAIMPTGAGKSLIYQFAALQLDGLTLVISPLIALMKDQVDALNRSSLRGMGFSIGVATNLLHDLHQSGMNFDQYFVIARCRFGNFQQLLHFRGTVLGVNAGFHLTPAMRAVWQVRE